LEVEFKVSYILDLMMHEVCSNSRTVRPAGWRLCQLLMMFLSGPFNLKFLHVCNVYSGLWRVSKERKCSTKKRLLHWHSILVCCWFLYWHPITLVRCRQVGTLYWYVVGRGYSNVLECSSRAQQYGRKHSRAQKSTSLARMHIPWTTQ